LEKWSNSYQNYLQKVNIESLNKEDTFYTTGYREIFTTSS